MYHQNSIHFSFNRNIPTFLGGLGILLVDCIVLDIFLRSLKIKKVFCMCVDSLQNFWKAYWCDIEAWSSLLIYMTLQTNFENSHKKPHLTSSTFIWWRKKFAIIYMLIFYTKTWREIVIMPAIKSWAFKFYGVF
jgi:hypothetical protein